VRNESFNLRRESNYLYAGAVVEDYGGGSAAGGAGDDNKEDAPDAAADADEYADMDDFEDENLVQEDDATVAPEPTFISAEEPDDTILNTRTYDLTISYDKYYQTPRVWLFGYDENRQPLTQDEIYEDIMQDYAKRTVTIEAHPHLGEQHASIHPCQHSAVMKRIVDHLCAGGKEPQISQYLFIFLKFIQSVIPTVDYDFTTEVEAGVTN
jgi:ubiquitin-like-conjugating enzyme ATG3